MRTARKEVEGWLGAQALMRTQRFLLRQKPDRVEEIGARLGRAIFKLSKKHRDRAMVNLALAFPEMSEAERLTLAKRVFEHYGKVTADFLTSSRRTQEQLDQSLSIEGMENLEAALAKGKGVILITGHFGNWERLSAYISSHGHKLTVIARDASNVRLNSMVNEIRQRTGTEVIPRGNAARPIIERLRRNELVGILPDQNTDELYVPFFGKLAGTVAGPGVLAERTGAAVVPMYCPWVGPQRYRMIIRPELVADEGGVKGEGMMRAINRSLEEVIREYPEQWLWFHDRWRTARRKGLL